MKLDKVEALAKELETISAYLIGRENEVVNPVKPMLNLTLLRKEKNETLIN